MNGIASLFASFSPRARRFAQGAGVALAGFASVATSAPPPPPAVPRPPQHVAVATDDGCAALTVRSCERSASSTFVVVEALGNHGQACEVRVSAAREQSVGGVWTEVDQVPAPLNVTPARPGTFALAFLRPASRGEQLAPVTVQLAVSRSAPGDAPIATETVLVGECSVR